MVNERKGGKSHFQKVKQAPRGKIVCLGGSSKRRTQGRSILGDHNQ